MSPKTRKPLRLSRETVRILQDGAEVIALGPHSSEGRPCTCPDEPVTY